MDSGNLTTEQKRSRQYIYVYVWIFAFNQARPFFVNSLFDEQLIISPIVLVIQIIPLKLLPNIPYPLLKRLGCVKGGILVKTSHLGIYSLYEGYY